MPTTFDEVIGQVLAGTSDTDVKETINLFNPSESKYKNTKRLFSSTVLKKSLESTSLFLESLKAKYPSAQQCLRKESKKKTELAEDIAEWLINLVPQNCLVCSEMYLPAALGDDENFITCFICNKKSHANCYDDKPINVAIGIVYICTPVVKISQHQSYMLKMTVFHKLHKSPQTKLLKYRLVNRKH